MKHTKIKLFDGLISERVEPINLQRTHISKFQNEFSKIIHHTYLYELPNVNVTLDGIVFKRAKIFSPSLHHESHGNWLGIIYIFLTRLLKKRIRKKGTYLLGFDYWGEGYYHWLLEELPRIYCSRKIQEEHTVLVPSKWNSFYSFRTMLRSFFKVGKELDESSFHHQSIELLGIKKLEVLPMNGYLFVEKLLMPSYTAPTGNYNDKLIKEINSFLFSNVEFSTKPKYDKIYLSRKQAPRRKVLNENEVEKLLTAHGYKCLCFEDFSFKEQVGLAGQCSSLISLHGAGLSNMLFMKQGSIVLELRMKGDQQNLCYYSLASALSINYYYLFCTRNADNINVQDANISVDLLELEKILQQF
ncbi:MAG: glycosyltransferase family 61 protein [Salinivirgaceae bacterium]|jgi:hypothetical protein|nr:glycosyltransferase family 61 protein [Salinivirgaceae bacterium]